MPKIILFALLTLASQLSIADPLSLKICKGEYALCAASPTAPTGNSITVKGTAFREGISVCPVLNGSAFADMSLMFNSCKAPAGFVWSLFSTETSYPQAPTWAVKPAVIRTFTTTIAPGGGMANQWSMLCRKRDKKVNGVTLADCLGPMNESPWTATTIPPGTLVGTAAPVGAKNPVGGNIPQR